MSDLAGVEVRLAARPAGMPTPADFAVTPVEVAPPGPGGLLVRNLFFSVDPYMRSRMDEHMIHMSPFAIGAALDGAAVGEVVRSRAPGFAEGDLVAHGLGWRDLAVVDAAEARPLVRGRFSPSTYLGALGMPGMTAWYGLHHVGMFEPGATVFVSAAAGAVGSTVGQLVKHHGGTVVASAGTAEKVRLLRDELGFDHVFCYRDEEVVDALARVPGGIDVYFDNVGGSHLHGALAALNPHGRVVACGAVAHANAPLAGSTNLPMIVGKRLTVQGFIVSDHYDLRPRFEEEMRPLVEAGAVRPLETLAHGVAAGPEALITLLRGGNVGKQVVAV